MSNSIPQDLDKKLREIKVKCYDGPFYLNDSHLSDKNIAQIIQAFKDSGWKPPINMHDAGDDMHTELSPHHIIKDGTYFKLCNCKIGHDHE